MIINMKLVCLITIFTVVRVKCNTYEGYVINNDDGISYKLMYQAKPWSEAKEVCALDGAKLAVPKSEEQFKFIQKLVRGTHYPSVTGTSFKLVAWLGINNLEDYRVWKNIDGEDIMQTGYHQWTTENNGKGFSDDPREPHCAVLDAINPGLRDFWCHRPQPFICEKRP